MSRESTVVVRSGVGLSCAQQGDVTEPAVVLLPGPTDSWRSYAAVLDHVPRTIRVVAVSQRGHGDSDRPRSGYAVDDFAGDVVGLLDALEIGRAVLVGHSGSCLIARRVAVDHPQRVAGLVLEASPTDLRSEEARRFVDSVVLGLTDPIDPDVARSFVVGTSSDAVAPEVVDRLVADVLRVPAHVWHEMFRSLLDVDDASELARIAAPTLLVRGDLDDLVTGEMQRVLADRIPRARLVEYAGVGHTPRWEDPRRFARDVAEFVGRVRAGESPDRST